jgi:hypothetical protein
MTNIKVRLNVIFFVNVILPLLIGGAIYLLFRSKKTLLFNIIQIVIGSNLLLVVRRYFCNFINVLPEWFLFSFPNALWVYSLSFCFLLFWRNSSHQFIWYFIVIILSLSFELLQSVQLITGTFSWIDIVFIILALLSSIVVIKNFNYLYNE